MVVDVSEIKDFRHCKRKWQLASRNSFHLRPKVTPKAFKIGTVFHECLHKLYLGKDKDEVLEYMRNEMSEPTDDQKDVTILTSMVRGYAEEVIPLDLERFEILDIEYHFRFEPYDVMLELGIDPDTFPGMKWLEGVEVAGSIDMIARERATNKIWGFEHKTAKNFRNDTFLWMDEQPRVYYVALMLWIMDYNNWKMVEDAHRRKKQREEGKTAEQGQEGFFPVSVGGVYINEVRKLVRSFETKRSALSYEESDIRNFMISFFTSCGECHKMVQNEGIPRVPQPDMMTCATCMFNTLCQRYQYADVSSESILKDFEDDFKVRESDHLEDKEQVSKEATNEI